MRKLVGKILCLVGDHLCTSMQEYGVKPDIERYEKDPIGYFFVYSTMFCARGCGKIYNRDLILKGRK